MATIFQNSTFKLNYMSVACLLSIIQFRILLQHIANEIIACLHYLLINPRSSDKLIAYFINGLQKIKTSFNVNVAFIDPKTKIEIAWEKQHNHNRDLKN